MSSIGTGMPDEGARWRRAHDMSAMLQRHGTRVAAYMHSHAVAYTRHGETACPDWPSAAMLAPCGSTQRRETCLETTCVDDRPAGCTELSAGACRQRGDRLIDYQRDDGGPVPTAAQYRNRVLAGFYPNPSAIRVDNDFDLVNSTFGYFPACRRSRAAIWCIATRSAPRPIIQARSTTATMHSPEECSLRCQHARHRHGRWFPGRYVEPVRVFALSASKRAHPVRCIGIEQQATHLRAQTGL